ncbi:MAG: DUF3472 domain-containing protein [Pedosphaera sp.]|nr:DUF3472 domain-containing protein [Pedosphaera sp.]
MKLPTLLLVLSCLTHAVCAAAEDAPKPRAARSIHLGFPAPDATAFYNEAVVDESVNGSYFMACGWNTGYFGIQQIGSTTNKVVIFSVWDPTKGDDAKAVPLEQRVEVLFEGEGVKVNRFGGEGTGGKSMFPHAWKIGETNRFLVEAKVEGEKTAYTGWFFLNEKREWKRLVTFRTKTGGKPLRGLYSFVEDFRRDTKSATEAHSARFGHGWVQTLAGDWQPLAKARFTASNAKTEAKETINAGVRDGWFFLTTGGATKQVQELNQVIENSATSTRPTDLPTAK